MILTLATAWVILATPQGAEAPQLPSDDRVRLAEAFRLAERVAHPYWPGWERAPFSVLLVTEDREYLVRHPHPPKEFASLGYDSLLTGEVLWRARTMPLRLAAALPIGGERTVVIGQGERLGTTSATSWVLNLLHEHFHQFQLSDSTYLAEADRVRRTGRDTSGTWMMSYPFPYDSASAATSFARMAKSLHAALTSVGREAFGARLSRYFEDRDAFAARVGPADYRFLSMLLWQEGVARYIEYRMAQAAAEGYEPLPAFTRLEDYIPYRRLAESHERRIVAELLERDLSQERREVVYPLGAAIALLLDAAAPGWKSRYLSEKFLLDRYFDP